MVYSPAEFEALFDDFGVPVTTAGTPDTTGVLLAALVADRELGVTLAREERVLVVRPGSLGPIEQDQLVLIGGTRYFYRGVAPVGHARTEHVIVARSLAP